MKKLLIQANNLDTVIDVFKYVYLHPGCSKQELADYCGFTLRQVDYYTNACKYLGLMNDDWSKTDLAIDIFTNHPAEVTERVYECIINDEVMGKVFSRLYVLPDDNIAEYSLDLVKKYFPGYSETVYERRSDNMVKWCFEIIDYRNDKY